MKFFFFDEKQPPATVKKYNVPKHAKNIQKKCQRMLIRRAKLNLQGIN